MLPPPIGPWGWKYSTCGVGSVYELPWHLLQGTEGLLKLKAFGDGLLLSSQSLLLWGGGLAALTQGVGCPHNELLCHWAIRFLFRGACAAGRFRTTSEATGVAGCLMVLQREDLSVWWLKPGVIETLLRGSPIPEHTQVQHVTYSVSVLCWMHTVFYRNCSSFIGLVVRKQTHICETHNWFNIKYVSQVRST